MKTNKVIFWYIVWAFFCTMLHPAFGQSISYTDTLAYYSFTGTNGTNIEGQALDIGGTWAEYNNQSEIQIISNRGEVFAQGSAGNFTHLYWVDVGRANEIKMSMIWRVFDADDNDIGLVAKTTGTPTDSSVCLFYDDIGNNIHIVRILGAGLDDLASTSFSASTNPLFYYRFEFYLFDQDSLVGKLYHFTDDGFVSTIDTLMLTLRTVETAISHSGTGAGILAFGGNNTDVTMDRWTVFWCASCEAGTGAHVRRRGQNR